MEIQEREGFGRCAVAARELAPGASILVEQATLFWRSGPAELVTIVKAYLEASDPQKKAIDSLTADSRVKCTELTDLMSEWVKILRTAKLNGELDTEQDEQALLPIVLRTHFNAHAIPGGAALFPEGAMINHSCSPNAFYRCEGQTIAFTAAKKLDTGDQITAAYLDALTMLRPTIARQEILLLSKGFLCACERCSSTGLEKTRAVRCNLDACHGVVHPLNTGFAERQQGLTPTWTCTSCQNTLSAARVAEIERVEDQLYQEWVNRDIALTDGAFVSFDTVEDAVKNAADRLHRLHYIAQFERVLAIETGITQVSQRPRLVAHAFTLANWLYESVPPNLLGPMTGAVAVLFDRRTYLIIPGLDIDRVLTIMKAIVPHAKLVHGDGAVYVKALESVVNKYSRCSSLICNNRGKLLRCGRCDSASYCSRSCQIFHYKSQGHKSACAAIVEAKRVLKELLEE